MNSRAVWGNRLRNLASLQLMIAFIINFTSSDFHYVMIFSGLLLIVLYLLSIDYHRTKKYYLFEIIFSISMGLIFVCFGLSYVKEDNISQLGYVGAITFLILTFFILPVIRRKTPH